MTRANREAYLFFAQHDPRNSLCPSVVSDGHTESNAPALFQRACRGHVFCDVFFNTCKNAVRYQKNQTWPLSLTAFVSNQQERDTYRFHDDDVSKQETKKQKKPTTRECIWFFTKPFPVVLFFLFFGFFLVPYSVFEAFCRNHCKTHCF